MTESKGWNPEGNIGTAPLTKYHRKVFKKALSGLVHGMPENGIYEPLEYSAHPENGVVIVRFTKHALEKLHPAEYHGSDINEFVWLMVRATGRSRCRAGDTFDLRKGIIIATWKLLARICNLSISMRKAIIKDATKDHRHSIKLTGEAVSNIRAMCRLKFGVVSI